jgi:hypothetical protein
MLALGTACLFGGLVTECRQAFGFFFQTEAISFSLTFFGAGCILYRDPFAEFVRVCFFTRTQKTNEGEAKQ